MKGGKGFLSSVKDTVKVSESASKANFTPRSLSVQDSVESAIELVSDSKGKEKEKEEKFEFNRIYPLKEVSGMLITLFLTYCPDLLLWRSSFLHLTVPDICLLVTDVDDSSRFAIQIQCGKRTRVIIAASAEQKKKWFSALLFFSQR